MGLERYGSSLPLFIIPFAPELEIKITRPGRNRFSFLVSVYDFIQNSKSVPGHRPPHRTMQDFGPIHDSRHGQIDWVMTPSRGVLLHSML